MYRRPQLCGEGFWQLIISAADLLPLIRLVEVHVPRVVGKLFPTELVGSPSAKPQELSLGRVERYHRQTELADVFVRQVVIVRNSCRTCFGEDPGFIEVTKREHASAGSRLCFKNGDVVVEFLKFVTGGESRESGADDNYLLAGRRDAGEPFSRGQ